MCLVLIAWRVHPRYPLIVAANRDEFYPRPTAPAARWPGNTGMLAGRDLQAGGSWMGVDAAGRFAAVTNFRELESGPEDARSRGELITDYLLGAVPAEVYLAELAERAEHYRGYNLLLAEHGQLYCASNRDAPLRPLPPGVHGVCNGPLDSDWPKVVRGRQLLASAIDCPQPDPDQLFDLLRDQRQPADAVLPDTGVGLVWERLLGSIAIDAAIDGRDYGTRSSSVLMLDGEDCGRFIERSRSDSGDWQQREFPIEPI